MDEEAENLTFYLGDLFPHIRRNASTFGWHLIEDQYLGGRDAHIFTTILCYEAPLPEAAIPSHIQVTQFS